MDINQCYQQLNIIMYCMVPVAVFVTWISTIAALLFLRKIDKGE